MDASRHGRLLLVEDESRLRGLIALFLRMEGFVVEEAEDGQQGVDRFGDSGPFDLVIVDLDLPRLPGVEVCRRIKSVSPSQPILVCSGAILGTHFDALGELKIDRILTKPYLPADLLGEVHRASPGPPSPRRADGPAIPAPDDSRFSPPAGHSRGFAPHSLVKASESK